MPSKIKFDEVSKHTGAWSKAFQFGRAPTQIDPIKKWCSYYFSTLPHSRPGERKVVAAKAGIPSIIVNRVIGVVVQGDIHIDVW